MKIIQILMIPLSLLITTAYSQECNQKQATISVKNIGSSTSECPGSDIKSCTITLYDDNKNKIKTVSIGNVLQQKTKTQKVGVEELMESSCVEAEKFKISCENQKSTYYYVPNPSKTIVMWKNSDKEITYYGPGDTPKTCISTNKNQQGRYGNNG